MSSFHLRGFSIPGPTRPTFVIPYFGLATSNAIFVQELDEQHRVAGFLMFEPAHFTDYMGPIRVVEQSVGAEGFVGFVNSEGKLVTGTASEIRRTLAEFSFAADGSDAFFATEVMEFRGDRSGLERAIDSAAKRFSDPERGMQWKAREISRSGFLSAKPAARAKERGDILRDLRSSMREPGWVARFSDAWEIIGSDPDLGDIALDWLNAGGIAEPEAGQLFNTLLTPSKLDRASDKTFVNPPVYVIGLARRWLEHMAFAGSQWASLWQKLRRRNQIDRTLSNEFGMRFLTVEPLERQKRKYPPSANAWMRVWRTLWIDDVERSFLVNLIQRHPELLDFGGFYKILELMSRQPEYEEMARVYFESWLERSPRNLPRWPKVCLDVITRYENRAYFVGLALEWLQKAGTGFHTWYGLWSGLTPYVADDTRADMGQKWLKHGHITMRIWPEVLADLIEMDAVESDEVFRSLARQWLQLGKRNRRRSVIEAFANRPINYADREVSGARLFLSYHFDADFWRVSQVRDLLVTGQGAQIQAVLEKETWDSLKKDGHLAVETFIENQLRAASVTLVLFSSETSTREWVRHEVMRSHELGLGLIAIDIHRLRNEEGEAGLPGPNPLSLWQVEIEGEARAFSDIYPTYDWVKDDGPSNISSWISDQMPRDHPPITAVKLLD